MNLGLAPERSKGTVELDPMVEFRQSVELLKNEYAQKALVRLRRAFECENHNPYYLSLLGIDACTCATELGSSLGALRSSGSTKTYRDPVPPESGTGVCIRRSAREGFG